MKVIFERTNIHTSSELDCKQTKNIIVNLVELPPSFCNCECVYLSIVCKCADLYIWFTAPCAVCIVTVHISYWLRWALLKRSALFLVISAIVDRPVFQFTHRYSSLYKLSVDYAFFTCIMSAVSLSKQLVVATVSVFFTFSIASNTCRNTR